MSEVVLLSESDDDEGSVNANGGPKTVSVNILNSKPLDLTALGLGEPIAPNRHKLCFTKPGHKSSPIGNRIKTKAGISHTLQILPLVTAKDMAPFVSQAVANSGNGLPESTLSKAIDPLSLMEDVVPSHSSKSHTNGKQTTKLTILDSGRKIPLSSSTTMQWQPSLNLSSRPSKATNASFLETDTKTFMKSGRRTSAPQPRLASYDRLNNYCFEAVDQSADDDRTFGSMKFKCTFRNCQQTVIGNVAFMAHLWAHVVSWKSEDDEFIPFKEQKFGVGPAPLGNEPHSDVTQLSTCPQCLTRFRSPIFCQRHYTRTHSRVKQAVSRGTCQICERDCTNTQYGPEGLRIHIAERHENEDEASYHCRRCKYRCNVRLRLYEHFICEHASSNSLMCPFCAHTVVIPAYKRKRKVIRVPEFVTHMQQHETEHFVCDRCSLSFVSLTERLKHIQKEHCNFPTKWTKRRLSPGIPTRSISHLRLFNDIGQKVCKECTELNRMNGGTHSKCVGCLEHKYRSCAFGVRRESLRDEFYRMGIDRRLMGRWIITCKCGYNTRIGDAMAQHYFYCSLGFTIVDSEPTVETGLNDHSDNGELQESELFTEKEYAESPATIALEKEAFDDNLREEYQRRRKRKRRSNVDRKLPKDDVDTDDFLFGEALDKLLEHNERSFVRISGPLNPTKCPPAVREDSESKDSHESDNDGDDENDLKDVRNYKLDDDSRSSSRSEPSNSPNPDALSNMWRSSYEMHSGLDTFYRSNYLAKLGVDMTERRRRRGGDVAGTPLLQQPDSLTNKDVKDAYNFYAICHKTLSIDDSILKCLVDRLKAEIELGGE